MNAKVIPMLFCDHAHREAETEKGTLVGIFDKILVKNFPAIHNDLFVVCRLQVSKGSHRLALTLAFPTEAQEKNRVIERNLEFENDRSSLFVMEIGPLELKVTGPYDFSLSVDGQEVGRATLEVAPFIAEGGRHEHS